MKRPVCRLAGLLAAMIASTTAAGASKSSQPPPYSRKPAVLSQQQVANKLGWISSKDKKNVCNGQYNQDTAVDKIVNKTSLKNNTTSVTAEGPTLFTSSGRSILQKNVIVTQPGRLVRADKAFIYRNEDTGKITAIELVGHVKMEQKDKLVLSQHAYLDLSTGASVLDDGLYHLYFTDKKNNQHDNAWGRAYQVKRQPNGIMDLYGRATYTTCPPIKPSWQIRAKHIHIDRKKKVVKAYGVLLKFKGFPLLYTPYYSFSMDRQRKSGILSPTLGYNSRNGADISLPIYWNMAPNYDMTITPRYISKRGYQTNGVFRFLSNTTYGKYFGNFLPGDKAFQRFKQNTLNDYPDTPHNQPYLNAIRHYSNNRWMFGINQHSDFSDNWKADFEINQVSDSYYLSDFNITANDGATANQLYNKADLIYHGQHWDFAALFEGYQTLHPINQAETADQYRRLPEIDSSAFYPNLGNRVDVAWSSSLVNFGYSSSFNPNQPTGQRAHFRPGLSMPINMASGYVTPSVYVDNTDYNINNPEPNQKNSLGRTLPIVNVDSGLYFNRSLHLGSHPFTSTIEPRLFYLFVPYNNQNDTPNFDTYRLPFSYGQLYSLNRFNGFDRLQNANQMSLGLTSRLLNQSDGRERFKFDLGGIYYFAKPRVCLYDSCQANDNKWSPLVSDVTFYPWSHWSTTASWAWDPNSRQTNNTAVTFNYIRDNTHLFTFQYNYVNDSDTSKYSNIAGGAYFPLSSRWNAIAYLYYNLTKKRPDSYYMGLEYDTCCWTLRFIADREYQNNTPPPHTRNEYSTGYYVQLDLKGLASLGNSNTDSLLLRTLPGYNPTLR